MVAVMKSFFRHALVQQGLSWVIARYIGLVFKTCRWTFKGRQEIQPYWDHKKPLISAFWHGRMLLMPCAWQCPHPFSMLISNHTDGKIIAQSVKYYGIQTIAGSKSRGGTQALRRILKCLKNGHSIGVTPDGPRGPREVVSQGIVAMARLSGVPVMPCTYAIGHSVVVPSWDRFRVPLPFSRGVLIWGKPLNPPSPQSTPEDLEAFRQTLEKALKTLGAQADALCGFKPWVLGKKAWQETP